MSIETPHVLVVGLGPAGARAAAAAAAAGLEVVAIERRREAGSPVQCAEFVPAMIDQDVPEVRSVARQMITRMLTFVENERPEETPGFHGRMIDRAAFDRMLAEQAAGAGAACRYGTSLLHIEDDGTSHTSDGRVLRPRILIGADGPRSLIGAAIGRVNRAVVETRQVTVPLVLPHDASDIFLSADYRGGYGWLFPKGAVANVGLGVEAGSRHRLKPLLTSLLERLARSGRIGMTACRLTGGAIPVGGRLRAIGALGQTAVLLAGDAAGLANPVTGAGIAPAVQSGALAGRAAADRLGGRKHALDAYEEELGDIFDAALCRAARRRQEMLARYARGAIPDVGALSDGWISSPRYWAAA